MFPSTHECTRAQWETFGFNANCKSQSTTELEDQKSKFETRLSVCLLLLLASTHNSSISMNCLFNSIFLVLIVFNPLKSAHKRYLTMDIDDAIGEDSRELSSSVSSLLSPSSVSSPSLFSIGPRLLHHNVSLTSSSPSSSSSS